MKNKRKLNKLMSIVLVLTMTFCLIGCGNTASPAVGEDVVVNGTEESTVENTESTMPPDGDDVITTVESDTESTNETEIEDGVVDRASGEEPAVTASPVPTAEPTPIPTAEPTPTPEHVHEYAETVVRQPSCSEAGEKQLICKGCDNVKTEAIPAMGHDFVTQYTTVEHAAVGHVEITEQQVQVGVGETRHEYECKYCGARFDTPEEKEEHCKATGVFEHAICATNVYDYPGSPIFETETVSNWVIDVPSWSEQVPSGSICSRCGVAGP